MNASEMHNLTGTYLKGRDGMSKANEAARRLQASGVDAPLMRLVSPSNTEDSLRAEIKALQGQVCDYRDKVDERLETTRALESQLKTLTNELSDAKAELAAYQGH